MMKISQLLLILLVNSSISFAQKDPVPNGGHSRFEKKGFVLNFTSNDDHFSEATKKRLIDAFFEVYPRLVQLFNPLSAKEVDFKIDTGYHGVAATSGHHVAFDPAWFAKNPEDIDVVTHEVMHIVQDYGNSVGPWWLTEGIADYVRYQYGINNGPARWKLPEYNSKQNYSDSYRVTARFFAWVEAKVKKGTVQQLNALLHQHTYTADSWKQVTGRTLDELWEAYGKDPVF